jgi:hypothetical protein
MEYCQALAGAPRGPEEACLSYDRSQAPEPRPSLDGDTPYRWLFFQKMVQANQFYFPNAAGATMATHTFPFRMLHTPLH